MSKSVEQMPTERCVELMAVGMANNLDEVWISENPMLLMTYINQYFPNFFRWYVFLERGHRFTGNILSGFLVATKPRIWSFHVAVLQWTAKKCGKMYHARATPLN